MLCIINTVYIFYLKLVQGSLRGGLSPKTLFSSKVGKGSMAIRLPQAMSHEYPVFTELP
jgi:hypothetical protein